MQRSLLTLVLVLGHARSLLWRVGSSFMPCGF